MTVCCSNGSDKQSRFLVSQDVLDQLKKHDEQQSPLTSNQQLRDREISTKIDWCDIDGDFSPSSLLGEGGFAKVYRVQVQNQPYALKCLNITKEYSDNEFVVSALLLGWEARLLSKLNHENIMSIRGVCSKSISDAFTSTETNNQAMVGYFFVMDILQDTLFDRLEQWRQEERQEMKQCGIFGRRKIQTQNYHQRIQSTVFGVVKGMEYLHHNNIVFADLKPENIGFDARTGTVKLFDFGLARRSINHCSSRLDPRATMAPAGGSLEYMAPEALEQCCSGSTTSTIFADLPSDVYSFGIVLWEICTLREKQFSISESKRYDPNEFIKKVVHKNVRPSLVGIRCKATKQLLHDCWESCPDRRPTFSRIWCRLVDLTGTNTNMISDCSYGFNQPIEAKILRSTKKLDCGNEQQPLMLSPDPSQTKIRKFSSRKLSNGDDDQLESYCDTTINTAASSSCHDSIAMPPLSISF